MLQESSILELEDMLLKVIIIGDSSVGKTNIVLRFSQDEFRPGHQSTIGVDFKMQSIKIDKALLKLQIWDTAGQQRHKTLSKTYYRGACGIILVYSITDESSFQNIQKWINQINDNLDDPGQIVLVGNKLDMQQQRKVSWGKGKQLSDKYDIKFIQVSAKTGQGIKQLFTMLGASVLKDLMESDKTKKVKQRKSLSNSNSKKCGNCSC